MHCLEVIVARNERAAAREEAYANNDHDLGRATEIAMANPYITLNYARTYTSALKEN